MRPLGADPDETAGLDLDQPPAAFVLHGVVVGAGCAEVVVGGESAFGVVGGVV
jgi:hypothetical protein